MMYELVMRIGHMVCHQIPERSISINGVQFFVCARCMGIYIGFMIAFLLALYYREFKRDDFHFKWCVLLLMPMAFDGTTQLVGLRESTNLLRLFTGMAGGIAMGWLTAMILGRALSHLGRFELEGGALPSAKTGGLTLSSAALAFLLMLRLLDNALLSFGTFVYWMLTAVSILSIVTIQVVILLMAIELLFRPNFALERKIKEIEGKER